MIELVFEGSADGTGTFVVAGDISINTTTHKLDMDTGSTSPARLTNIKKHN